ncbi:glycosyltransferase family 2 protein [Blautia sp. MSJ-9]|uniref:glycosyltransferase family 2 protein n=1 Tax=Blautia sp. MSJ-9 TaxID=2841511 RepID=UPI001C120569|nr:glycosyltransferase family 2 protein [Blautia sp. MSJ-9]MBU5681115.1 glycosyltransferase [Blautia sp. MSJ-9]
MPQISIIVPVYNTEKYLKKCIESLQNQMLTDIQIILVNDGSKDKSGEICEEYAKKDLRIKVIHKENGGLSDARNVGIAEAEAECIGFVDSDDYVDPKFFYELYKKMQQYKADIAVGGIRHIDNLGKILNVRCIEEEAVFDRYGGMKELLFSKRISNSVCNKIFRRELFKEVCFPKGRLYEDEFVTYRLFDKAQKSIMVNTVFYYYRSNPKSITHREFSVQELDRIIASEMKIRFCKEKYPDLVKYVEYYMIYDCANVLMKMKHYEKQYDNLIRVNIKRYWKIYVKENNSLVAKVFVVLARVSPQFTIWLFRCLKRNGI